MGRKIFFYTLAFVLLNFHAVGAAFKTDNVTISGQKSKASLSTDSDGKIVEGSGGANDTVYGSGWNGSTAQAPSQNAVYDKVEALVLGGGEGSTVADKATIDLTLTGTEIKGDVILLKDLVTTAPLTGGTNDVFPGADADITIAIANADDDDSTKGAATFNNTNFDVASGLVTIATGGVSSTNVLDHTITGTDITNTTIDDIKKKEFNIIFTVLEPDSITNATGLPTRAFLVPFPSDTRTYTISSIQSFSDVDNANFSLLKSVNATNVTAAACVYLQNVTIADNGESVFSNTTTALTNATIEAGKHLIFQNVGAVNDTYKKLIIKGNFS